MVMDMLKRPRIESSSDIEIMESFKRHMKMQVVICNNNNNTELSKTLSAEKVVGNDDLLIEILMLFPPKTLIRFKSVSKHWYNLISDPYFSASHMRRHRQCHHLQKTTSFMLWSSSFYYFNPTSQIFTPFTFDDFEYPHILQSTNGLLLLNAQTTSVSGLKKEYFVYNPTTRQSRNLFIDKIDPLLCHQKNKASIVGLYLVFDPTTSPFYKVICTRRTTDKSSSSSYRTYVYDSETHTWNYYYSKVGREGFQGGEATKLHKGIFWNNGIYWIRTSVPKSFYLDLDKKSLETLNVGVIKTHWQRRPGQRRVRSGGPSYKVRERKKYVIESNGRLYCVTLCLSPEYNSLLIHEMISSDDDNNSFGWVEKYNGDIVNPRISKELDGEVSILGMFRGGGEQDDEQESYVLLHVTEKIITYWFSSGAFEVLDLTKHGISKSKLGVAFEIQPKYSFQFIESLAPV